MNEHTVLPVVTEERLRLTLLAISFRLPRDCTVAAGVAAGAPDPGGHSGGNEA